MTAGLLRTACLTLGADRSRTHHRHEDGTRGLGCGPHRRQSTAVGGQACRHGQDGQRVSAAGAATSGKCGPGVFSIGLTITRAAPVCWPKPKDKLMTAQRFCAGMVRKPAGKMSFYKSLASHPVGSKDDRYVRSPCVINRKREPSASYIRHSTGR